MPDLAQIVSDYKLLGTLVKVAEKNNLTAERIRQLIVKFENKTGTKIPRTGRSLRSNAAQTIEWACASCGQRQIRNLRYAARTKICHECNRERVRNSTSNRKLITDEIITDTIVRRLTGESWVKLALDAGYTYRGSGALIQAVYAYLARNGDKETEAKLWPKGPPNWLVKKNGEIW
jgi:hypothetical protein